MSDVYGTIGTAVNSGLSAGLNVFNTWWNNKAAAGREATARRENFEYNEQSAENADARTRALYDDLYSPKAQMKQIKEAGLSPSIFYGDMNGISGQTGAQGSGAAGIAPNTYGLGPIDLANLALIGAQTDKTRAETQNIKSQTQKTDLENEIKELENSVYKEEWSLINIHIKDNNDNLTSLYEIANECGSYEAFVKYVRSIGEESDPQLKYATTNEIGQKFLREIFEASRTFDRNIAVLSREKVDAKFYEDVTKCLEKNNFASLNAQEAVAELRRSIQVDNLDERQRRAWNNLIKKLEDKSSTGADIAITLLLMLNNALTNYRVLRQKK